MSDFQNITGAIFDVDGTLLDSMYIWDELLMRYLSTKNLSPFLNSEAEIKNMTLSEGCQYIQAMYSLKDSVATIEKDIKQILMHFYRDEVLCKREVLAYVKQLFALHIPMIITTTSDLELVMPALKRNQMDHYFQSIISCDAHHFTKRDSAIYRYAASQIHSPIHTTAVFEDAYYAIATASKAGFIVYGVADAGNLKDKKRIQDLCDEYISGTACHTRRQI